MENNLTGPTLLLGDLEGTYAFEEIACPVLLNTYGCDSL